MIDSSLMVFTIIADINGELLSYSGSQKEIDELEAKCINCGFDYRVIPDFPVLPF